MAFKRPGVQLSYLPRNVGVLAHLVERFVRNEEATGSSPVDSTAPSDNNQRLITVWGSALFSAKRYCGQVRSDHLLSYDSMSNTKEAWLSPV